MEKIKRFLRLFLLICLMVLASIGLSITGAAPPLPKDKETVMEEDKQKKKSKKKGNRPLESKKSE